MLVLYLFFQLTKTGMAMRATAQSQVAARLMGVSVRRIFSMTWAISAGISGIAGVLIAPIIYLDPNLGVIGVKAFAGAVLGGFGNIPGAIVGGMLLGILENLSGYFSMRAQAGLDLHPAHSRPYPQAQRSVWGGGDQEGVRRMQSTEVIEGQETIARVAIPAGRSWSCWGGWRWRSPIWWITTSFISWPVCVCTRSWRSV